MESNKDGDKKDSNETDDDIWDALKKTAYKPNYNGKVTAIDHIGETIRIVYEDDEPNKE